MIYPSIDDLLKNVDSKYTLVIMSARRARQIRDGSAPTTECGSKKDVSIALKEIAEGNIEYERLKDGIK